MAVIIAMKRLLFLLLSFAAGNASAQPELKGLLQKHWRSDFIRGSDRMIQYLYSIKFDESDAYTGMGGLTIISGGEKYSMTYRISGRLYHRKKSGKAWLSYKEGETVSEDRLPERFTYCRESGSLWIYADKDEPGSLFLESEFSGCDSALVRIFR